MAMRILRHNENNYEDAAQALAQDGLVGFDVFPSRAHEVMEATLELYANMGHATDPVAKDFTLTDDGYVYILRNQELVDGNTCALLTQIEYARMFAN